MKLELNLPELRELVAPARPSVPMTLADLAEQVDAYLLPLELRHDFMAAGKAAVYLHGISKTIQDWLARAAADVGVPPPTAAPDAPAPAPSTNEQEAP